MQMIGLARLGRDAELRHTSNGDAVASLSLAFNFGRKGTDGKRPTQWVEASLWGKLAESLIDYLTKGTQVCVTLDEPHIETYQTKDGREGTKLSARVMAIELASGGQQQQREAGPAQPARPQQQAQRPPAAANRGEAFEDDDIPF